MLDFVREDKWRTNLTAKMIWAIWLSWASIHRQFSVHLSLECPCIHLDDVSKIVRFRSPSAAIDNEWCWRVCWCHAYLTDTHFRNDDTTHGTACVQCKRYESVFLLIALAQQKRIDTMFLSIHNSNDFSLGDYFFFCVRHTKQIYSQPWSFDT